MITPAVAKICAIVASTISNTPAFTLIPVQIVRRIEIIQSIIEAINKNQYQKPSKSINTNQSEEKIAVAIAKGIDICYVFSTGDKAIFLMSTVNDRRELNPIFLIKNSDTTR